MTSALINPAASQLHLATLGLFSPVLGAAAAKEWNVVVRTRVLDLGRDADDTEPRPPEQSGSSRREGSRRGEA